ncbi:Solute carrier family 22 member 3 [Papilio machaon]|uniref:glutathione transferase n=1 Tax=Papilio machaon TaxID=76193 RepID=A0A0N1IFY4_PAPMA|nr:Solute carrier family 22 member 3 [Papilio machaon]
MGANDTERNEKEEIEIIETMEKFGRYQMLQYFLICLPAVVVTMLNVNYVFVAGEINYRCRIPECDDQYPVYNTSWWPNKNIDRCTRPLVKELTGGSCTNDSFSEAVAVCTDWVYETNDTVIAELDLGCQPWKSNLIGTIHNVGFSLAMLASGWMADRFGRLPTLILCSVGSCIGILKVFASTYYAYVLIELIEATIAGGTYTSAMVLMIEIGGKKNRVLAGVIFAYAIYVGETLFALIAMFVPYWKNLVLIIYSPAILSILLLFVIKESPRWQLLNNKTKSAKKTLLHVAKINKVNINNEKLLNMNEENLKKEFNIDSYEEKEGLTAIFKSREIIKRSLVAAFCKFTSGFVYYGLMVNSVFLPGNKYTNFMLASVMSYPGELISLYLMNKIGRKFPLIYGYVLSGLLCAACGWIPEDYTWLKITVFLLGKLIVSVCYTGVITYTMELFPTSVRGTLLGVCSVSAAFGSMLAPLTPILVKTPHGVMPLLEFDGKVYGQSFAICRYLGKKYGLAGNTLEEDLVIDQNTNFYADVRLNGIQSFWEPDASVKAVKQEALVKTVYPELLPKLEKILKENNGYMALGRLTWADFVFAGFYEFFKQQSLIPDMDEKYPSFKKLRETVMNVPAVKKYLESKSK